MRPGVREGRESPPASHQTVRLSVGRHGAPEDGMCVMELASVLGGERFSDHPSSVCPIVAAFLRGYNDHLSEELRTPWLLRWATDAVGTRHTDPEVIQARADLARRMLFELVPRHRRLRLGQGAKLGCRTQINACQLAGSRLGTEVCRRPALAAVVDHRLERVCATGSSPFERVPARALRARATSSQVA